MTRRSNDEAISLKEVQRLCGGRSRAWVYKAMTAGKFPRGFSLGPRSRVWWRSDVIEFLEGRERLSQEVSAA